MKTNAPPPDRSVMRDVKRKLRSIENSLFPTLAEVFDKYSSVIKDANTQQQLFILGQDSKAVSLGSYAASTIRIKIRKRQPIDRVTLKDTGALYEDITVTATEDSVIIDTSISYAKYLVKRYGKEILGIQDVFLRDFVTKYVLPELEKSINKIIVQ